MLEVNFAFWGFSEVQQTFRIRTWGRVLRGSGLFASYILACISERVLAHSTTTKKIG
jgi:hypothetical protein